MRFDGEWMRPSLLSVTLAGFGEAIILAVQYRETVEDVGMGVFRHYYWPWYVHGHGDHVTPVGALPFALNFLTGVVLFLPLTQALTWVLRRSARWPVDPTDGLRHPSPRGGQDRAHVHRRDPRATRTASRR